MFRSLSLFFFNLSFASTTKTTITTTQTQPHNQPTKLYSSESTSQMSQLQNKPPATPLSSHPHPFLHFIALCFNGPKLDVAWTRPTWAGGNTFTSTDFEINNVKERNDKKVRPLQLYNCTGTIVQYSQNWEPHASTEKAARPQLRGHAT